MSWNYENYVKEQIHRSVTDTRISSDYNFEVCTEQAFVKKKSLSPTTIYVIIKYLSSTNTLNAVEQPVQLIILCEDNQIQVSQIVFGNFVSNNNFKEMTDGSTYIKQDYREPVVLSNFNQTAYGYRTVMYISGTLFLMENIIDISVTEDDITYDNSFSITVDEETEVVRPVNFNIAYSMTPNTQQIPPTKIATSVKSVSTFSITFTVPFTSTYNFLSTMSNIMSGVTSGNTSFVIKFKLNNTSFNVPMKLVSCQVTTAINQVPGVQIGLIR